MLGAESGSTTPQPRRRRAGRLLLVVVLLIAGLAGTGGGGAILVLELTRHATPAEAAAASRTEIATLWQRLTAEQLFPERVPYQNSLSYNTTATLVGIAPRTSCAAATDPAVATSLDSVGCVALLRATYADSTGTVIATVGVAVLPSLRAASAAYAAISSSNSAGLRAAGFPGTVSSAFTDAAREVFGAGARGPYLVMYTAGYVDGRTTSPEPTEAESATTDLGSSLRDAIGQVFMAPLHPCTNRYISC